MTARLERGDVLLTARIVEVLGEVVVCVMPGDLARGRECGKAVSCRSCQFGSLAKGKNALSVKSDGEFATQARFNFRLREPQASCNRVRNSRSTVMRGPV